MRGWVDGERDTAKQEVAQRLRARGDHASVLLSREEDDREAAVVGWARKKNWAGSAAGKRQVSLSLLFLLFMFSIFCLCFLDLVKY